MIGERLMFLAALAGSAGAGIAEAGPGYPALMVLLGWGGWLIWRRLDIQAIGVQAHAGAFLVSLIANVAAYAVGRLIAALISL